MPALRELVQQMLDAEEYSAARLIVGRYANGDTVQRMERRIDAAQAISEARGFADVEVPDQYKWGL
jgi:hypothetical protein